MLIAHVYVCPDPVYVFKFAKRTNLTLLKFGTITQTHLNK